MVKRLGIACAAAMFSGWLSAQTSAAPAAAPPAPAGAISGRADWPKPQTADVDSIEHIVAALYDVISGPAHQPRDWNRMRSLFVPGARLIPVRLVPGTADASSGPKTDVLFLTIDDYVKLAAPRMESEGFFERGIRNETDKFGNMVSVFSTYESRHALADPAPFARGINSIQLLKDGSRYWIVDVFWDSERPGSAVPPRYLPKKAPEPEEK